jgi:hypothetical protein
MAERTETAFCNLCEPPRRLPYGEMVEHICRVHHLNVAETHHVWDCPVNGCMVCMPPVAIALAPADIEALKAERDRYRSTLRRAQGYILDLADGGNEGAALLSRRIAEDLDGVGEALDA